MINLNELRLGNWVYSIEVGKNVQVSSINEDCVTFKDTITWDYVYAEMIEPIPLTEELLLKCGFERKSYLTKGIVIEVSYYQTGNIVIYLLRDFYEIEIITSSGQFNLRKTFPKRLHHLQNLYYSLTGKELEIKK